MEDRAQKRYVYFHIPDEKNDYLKILNLEIKNITRVDAGNYTCFAMLGSGLTKKKSFHLKVGKKILLLANINNYFNIPYFLKF